MPLTFIQKAIPKLKLTFVPAQEVDVPKRKRVLTSTSEAHVITSKHEHVEKKSRAGMKASGHLGSDFVMSARENALDKDEKENVVPPQ